ncbi:hypothetical protein RHECNPAF_770075 [Rhizobium etli CNPAF512]|nr:hypothetical protein RHECNPAF_770075 [Rhizobium etli CNPAF512]
MRLPVGTAAQQMKNRPRNAQPVQMELCQIAQLLPKAVCSRESWAWTLF